MYTMLADICYVFRCMEVGKIADSLSDLQGYPN